MIRPTTPVRIGLASALFLGMTGFALVLTDFKPVRKVPLGSEKELKATIEGGLADIHVARGTASTILEAEMARDEDDSPSGTVDYSARGGIGYVSVDLNPDGWEGDKKKKKGHGSISVPPPGNCCIPTPFRSPSTSSSAWAKATSICRA